MRAYMEVASRASSDGKDMDTDTEVKTNLGARGAESLDLMASSLRWQHVAPSAPDTLACYPYKDRDPFYVAQSPHVYFAGNQPAFGARLVRDGVCVHVPARSLAQSPARGLGAVVELAREDVVHITTPRQPLVDITRRENEVACPQLCVGLVWWVRCICGWCRCAWLATSLRCQFLGIVHCGNFWCRRWCWRLRRRRLLLLLLL